MIRHLLAPALLLFSMAAVAQTAARQAPAGMPGFVPQAGPDLDYEVLESPQPTWGQGKIEVAEVFSYACIHCAEFQHKVNAWRKAIPADVRWEYVPAVFGGTFTSMARAYFAAELMKVQPRTHDLVFKGVFVDKFVQKGTDEEIAAMYARWGVDKAKFIATMNSFGVTGKLNRARQFALRTGVQSTPTIIVNGKYRVNVTPQRGFDGMLATTNWLIAKERAAARAAKPAPAKKG